MNKVAIIGYGVVGQAYRKVFPEAIVYDKTYEEDVKRDVNRCKLALICVPTPSKQDGSVDLSAVKDVLSWLNTDLILIKSTIPPGTTDALKKKYKKRICFSPEYVGESSYYIPEKYLDPTDPRSHPFQTFGGDSKDTAKITEIFQEKLGPTKTYMQADAVTVEIAKYMENCFFATKITFCNEFYDICERFKVDYGKVRQCWLLDPRINDMHTCVFPNKRGFGGKCLPKDLRGIIYGAEKKGAKVPLLNIINQINHERRYNNLSK